MLLVNLVTFQFCLTVNSSYQSIKNRRVLPLIPGTVFLKVNPMFLSPQAETSDPVCSGAKWQEADPSSGVPWSSASSNSGSVTPTTVWQHTVPSTMPWVTPPSVHNTENMYTFNGLSCPPLSAGSPR